MKEYVSINMLAYNHEKWIAKAIEGVVNQKTKYKFKLYIHDDFSSDHTTEIIKEYVDKYPNIIVPFYETENQYQKGVEITKTIMLPKMNGKYIAMCEGDDFWIDQYKLEKQINYMESNLSCSMCFHNAVVVDMDNKKIRNFFPQKIWNDKEIIKKINSSEDSNFSTEEMIKLDFVPTASLVLRMDNFKEVLNFPYSLDLLVRLVGANRGETHYINQVMSAYRTNNPHSASGKVNNSMELLKKNFYDLHCNILDEFDKYTCYIYSDDIYQLKQRKELRLYSKEMDLKKMKATGVFTELCLEYKFKLYLKKYFSGLFYLLKKINIIIFRKTS